MTQLLLEIGTEELPPKEIPRAVSALKTAITEMLEAEGMDWGGVHTHWTPRRMVVAIDDVPERSPSRKVVRRGPAVAAAWDEDGEPTRACQGFARGQGVDPSELVVIQTGKGDYVGLEITEGDRALEEVLSDLAPRLGKLPWRRSMRWAKDAPLFARSIKWVLARHGDSILSLTVGPVQAGKTSMGHRFAGMGAFAPKDCAELMDGLRTRKVLLDPGERLARIEAELDRAGREAGGSVEIPPGLLDEVVAITEWPSAIVGQFPAEYLDIPEEIVVTAMVKHQRYFPLRDARGGLMPSFVGISNAVDAKTETVAAGYAKVLWARLEDGRFFYNEDRKTSLEERVPKLSGIVFLRGLGTLQDKVQRLQDLAAALAIQLQWEELEDSVRRAALLCKSDLLTEVVGEFPELQGIMGQIYAQEQGETQGVAEAMAQHYLPRHATDELPTEPLGVLLALADRLDTLAGAFGIGKVPTGSADPFGLRRAALGVLRILMDGGQAVKLSDLIAVALDGYPVEVQGGREQVLSALQDFFRTRLKVELRAADVPAQVAEAVLSAGYDDVADTRARALALASLDRVGSLAEVLEPFRRCLNIVEDPEVLPQVDPALFQEDSERALWQGLQKHEGEVLACVERRDYETAFGFLPTLQPLVSGLFAGVMVNADDPLLRNNRLALVWRVASLFHGVADFAQIGR